MADESVGDVLRAERQRRHLTLAQAGELVGYSSSALSRIEHGQPLDIDSLRGLARRYDIPPHRLGLATLGDRYTIDGSGDDDVQRRQFLITAAGVSVPHGLLTRLDDALVSLPQAPGPVTAKTVTTLLATSRALFDAANYTTLVAALPDLMAAAHEHADTTDDPAVLSRVAACYELATHTLDKIGRHQASRLTADRAMIYARQADSPLAIALSSRALGVVLRHEGRPLTAQRVNLDAIGMVEATGLVTIEQRAVLAQMLCSAAYSAGQGGDRDRALELINDAHRAVRGLPDDARNPVITPAQVQLYQVGVHWALGNSARALDSARGLRPAQFPTPERRGRLHTDLARAWWQHSHPEHTATALLAAHREAPTEVTERPAIRRIALDVINRHPHLT
ncbi:MAG: helix-turn-helix domain-containing protein, partial [Actinomycetota bacterium]|nr:helix-turn-helix domain-containing protein [Actinomycetota bacterium]